MKISAAIITFNEEKNIQRCLDSLASVVDEIIVIDSFSNDQTEEICRRNNVTFIQNKFEGHIQQKNYAISQCKHDYILSLDADEALSPELKDSIISIKNSLSEYDAYYFNRRTQYVDQWIYHCGWYPDKKTRLFHRQKAKWGGHNPHDIIIMQEGSNLKKLNGDLLHYSYNSISEHINQTNKFTTIAAQTHFDQGVRSSRTKIITRAFSKFIRDYFFKKGFLDGHYGLIICSINSLSAFLKYAKIYELQKNKQKNKIT